MRPSGDDNKIGAASPDWTSLAELVEIHLGRYDDHQPPLQFTEIMTTRASNMVRLPSRDTVTLT